jgi:hypothetical protein
MVAPPGSRGSSLFHPRSRTGSDDSTGNNVVAISLGFNLRSCPGSDHCCGPSTSPLTHIDDHRVIFHRKRFIDLAEIVGPIDSETLGAKADGQFFKIRLSEFRVFGHKPS